MYKLPRDECGKSSLSDFNGSGFPSFGLGLYDTIAPSIAAFDRPLGISHFEDRDLFNTSRRPCRTHRVHRDELINGIDERAGLVIGRKKRKRSLPRFHSGRPAWVSLLNAAS